MKAVCSFFALFTACSLYSYNSIENIDEQAEMESLLKNFVEFPCPTSDIDYPSKFNQDNPLILTCTVFLASSTPSHPLKFTPFVTTPKGKVILGESVVRQEASFDLPPIVVRHPSKGNHVTGYFVSLPQGSSPLTTGLSCTGWVTGMIKDTVEICPIPGTPILARLINSGAIFPVSGNFESKAPNPFSWQLNN